MNILIFAFVILNGSVGAVLMKKGARVIGHVEIHSFSQFISYIFKLFTTPESVLGIFLYFFSAVIWSYLLTKLELSFVQPILALTYVATPLLAVILLNETVSTMRWIGIFIIIFGVFVVSRTAA